MAGEIFQAQVIRSFFETITGPDRNLTRIYRSVISLAKLRLEPPERQKELIDQLRKSREKKELSVDILDYVCTAAIELELSAVQTAFGVTEMARAAQDFEKISLDSL
jgi:hypothetical protein